MTCPRRTPPLQRTSAAAAEVHPARHTRMPRDIDHIIERLKTELPGVQVTQLQVGHPGADDDGLWFIRIPGRAGEVQIESSRGSCPFLIESDFSTERLHGRSIDEVVSTVRRLYA